VVLDLQRITTDYIETEDRIRLVAEIGAANTSSAAYTLVLWLTRRLLDRLIPHLTLWLEQQQGNVPRLDILHSFVQQTAERQLEPESPVSIKQNTQHWLVETVDIRTGTEQLQLTFKNAARQAASLNLAATPLRQWLSILHQQYQVAQKATKGVRATKAR
jgi:hypothetical protein